MRKLLKPIVLVTLIFLLMAVAIFLLNPERKSLLELTSLPLGTNSDKQRYSVSTIRIDNPSGTLVKMRGYFVAPLFYSNDYLMGDFVLQNDPQQAPQRILIVGRNGNFTLGKGTNEEIKWELATDVELVNSVQANQLVELRFVFYDNEENEGSVEMQQRLQKLTQDETLVPNEYQLTPVMIGIGALHD